MKRKIAAIIALTMSISALSLPSAVYAVAPVSQSSSDADKSGEDANMKKAIVIAKSSIDIPDTYTDFEYNTYQSYGLKSFRLTWKKPGSDESISVSVCGDTITSFSRSTKNNYSNTASFASFTEEQFEKKAIDWIVAVDPSKKDCLKKSYYSVSLNNNYVYINFERVNSGISVNMNSISISLDKHTGEVIRYNSNWWQNASFVSPSTALTQESISDIYKSEVNIKPWYRISADENGRKTANIVYEPLTSPVYDATTGKHSTMQSDYNEAMNTDNYTGTGMDGAGDYIITEEAEEDAEIEAPAYSFSEQELAAADELSKMLTSEKFRKLLLKDKYMNITDKYIISNYELQKSDAAECGYAINCTMSVNNKSESRTVYINADAKTGKIMSFYSFDSEASKRDLDVKKANTLAVQAAKYYYGDIFSEFRAVPENTEQPSDKNGKVTERTMVYNRYVNNIQVSGNSINISVNSAGKVTSIHCSYEKGVDFGDGLILNKSNALGMLLTQQELSLNYDGFTDLKSNPHTYLHYTMESWHLNAKTGKLCDYNGNEIKASSAASYTDIASSPYRAEIETLCQYGVNIYEGDKFMPEEKITVNELTELMNIITGYNYIPIPLEVTDTATGKTSVLNKSDVCTRKELAKIFARAAGVDSCAKFTSIFKSPFKDISESDSDMGYFALAYGMGALKPDSKGNIYPNAAVTRGYAYHCAYNYIKNNSEK